MIEIHVESSVQTAVEPSQRVCEVAAMFGLGVDGRRTIAVVPPTTLRIGPGRVIFITGASGGGKTTLLRRVREALEAQTEESAVRVIDFATLGELEDRPLVDAMGGSLTQAVRWLALAGLNDAFVMLRRPSELSDGQRYRLRLAQAMAIAEQTTEHSGRFTVVLADEFGATLDRTTAKVIAANVRKWTRRGKGEGGERRGERTEGGGGGVCFIAATTHDDLLEPLEPDVLIVQHPGAGIEVLEREN